MCFTLNKTNGLHKLVNNVICVISFVQRQDNTAEKTRKAIQQASLMISVVSRDDERSLRSSR